MLRAKFIAGFAAFNLSVAYGVAFAEEEAEEYD